MSHRQPTHPANHLADENSPYLLQHAHNPVDWYPWGEAAFARARALKRPIFLSVGYAACHWCHVMERESFEDTAVAAILNEHYVAIKVDREELPDVDELYMATVQLLTGHGGWPMSVFLTPDLQPFYGGTYYPPTDRPGMPSFTRVLQALAKLWRERRDDVLHNATEITTHLRQYLAASAPAAAHPGSTLDDAPLRQAVAELDAEFDERHGGFGGAPKFPPSNAIALLLRTWRRTGDAEARHQALFTLDRMAAGGMYDHLGGGFARYSVDDEWLVPHFEKMLYDNALLSSVYLEAHQATGAAPYAAVARATLDYVLRDLADEAGGFHSSEDADSEGEEGLFYTWTPAEIAAALPADEAKALSAYYGVTNHGNFERRNILYLPTRPAPAGATGATDVAATPPPSPLLESARARLLAARALRVRPGKDDKVLTAWNGLMISSLARGAQILGEPRYRQAAERAASFCLGPMRPAGELLRCYRRGHAKLPAYLEDYAFLAAGLLDLYEATGATSWLHAADELAQVMVARFWDAAEGGFFFTHAGHGQLLARTKPTYDGATPSGNAVATMVLLRLADLLDRPPYAAYAQQHLLQSQAALLKAPRAHLNLLLAQDYALHPRVEVVLVGDPADPRYQALAQAVSQVYVPQRVLAAYDPGDPASAAATATLPLLAGKSLAGGQPTAYLCRAHVCGPPLTDPAALRAALAQ